MANPEKPVITYVSYSEDTENRYIDLGYTNYVSETGYSYLVEVSNNEGIITTGSYNIWTAGNAKWSIAKSTYSDDKVKSGHSVRVILTYGTYRYESDKVPVMMCSFNDVQVFVEENRLQISYKLPDYLQMIPIVESYIECAGEGFFHTQDMSQGSVSYEIPKNLLLFDREADWIYQITPYIKDISSGLPFAPITLVNKKPIINSLEVDCKNDKLTITVGANGLSGSNANVSFYENNQYIEAISSPISDNKVTIPLDKELNAGTLNTVCIRRKDDHMQGMSSTQKALLLSEPSVRCVEYSSDKKCSITAMSGAEVSMPTEITVKDANGDIYKGALNHKFSFDFQTPSTICIAQSNKVARGPFSKSTSVIQDAVAITGVETNENRLTITRGNLPAGGTNCRYLLYKNGIEIDCFNSKEASIVITSDQIPDEVAVQAVGVSDDDIQLVGSLSNKIKPLFILPTITSLTLNGETLTCNWNTIADCTYVYKLNEGEIQVATTAQCSIKNIPQNQRNIFKVRAVQGVLKGSWVSVPVEPLTIFNTGYDGKIVFVQWKQQDGTSAADHYKVEWLGDGTAPSVIANAVTKEMKLSMSVTSHPKSVSVQAIYKDVCGIKTEQQNVFSTGFYLGKTKTEETISFIPNGYSLTTKGDMQYTTKLVTPNVDIDNEIFTLNADKSNVYTLTIKPAVWNFTDENRTLIKQKYSEFLGLMKAASATAWDIFTIKTLIGKVIPQTYKESMFYNFGYDVDSELGCIDLQPGMSLRVEYESRQEAMNKESGGYKEGYLQVGSSEYELVIDAATPHRLVMGFDSFFTNMAKHCMEIKNPKSGNQTEQGAGGLVDFNAPKMSKAFYRLVMPSDYFAQDDDGQSLYFWYMTILASDDYTLLDAETKNLREALPIDSTEVEGIYIMGRATIVPCIKIFVSGTPISVPVGTTIAQILQWKGIYLNSLLDTMSHLDKVTIKRSITCQKACDYPINGYESTAILLEYWNESSIGNKWMNLPMLSGDEIWLK